MASRTNGRQTYVYCFKDERQSTATIESLTVTNLEFAKIIRRVD